MNSTARQGITAGLLAILCFFWLTMQGCVGMALVNYATDPVECDAIRSDRARGYDVTSPWFGTCDEKKQVVKGSYDYHAISDIQK